VAQLKDAKNFESVKTNIEAINVKRNFWESMSTIAEVNHFSDLTNQSFEEAVNYYEKYSGDLKVLVNAYYLAIVDSAYRPQIAEVYGQQLIEIALNEARLFEENLKELQAEESKLVSEFGKVFYQIQYQIGDTSYSEDSIKILLNGTNRNSRKKAVSAKSIKFAELENSIAEIIIQIIKVRNNIAKACGFENYVVYAFKKLGRYNYGVADIEKHRNGIVQSLVPLTTDIRNRQSKRIGVNALKFHDYDFLTLREDLIFKFDSVDTIGKISEMFGNLSKETGDLFQKMQSNELIDYTIKKNRMPGNFAFYIPEKKTPFLHTNFTNSKEDFILLCHEFGHAFAYLQSNTAIPEYVYPFVEGAETQAIAMEYFCWAWVEQFFGDNTKEYKYCHLASGLLYLPQLSLIDEFEQFLYENEPENAEELRVYWKKTERKYLPFIAYGNAPFFADGGRYLTFANWFVDYPLWSICYSLAQINAFQMWNEFETDRTEGWRKYVQFCKQGGRSSVLDSLKACAISSPLDTSTVDSVIKVVYDRLVKMV